MRLYPRDIQARADINRWLFWSTYHFRRRSDSSAASGCRRRWSAAPAARIRPRLRVARPCSAADVLDRNLADKQWIAQDRLTLADLAIAAPLMHTAAAQLPVTGYRHLQAWFARVSALDAWHKTAPPR